MNTETTSTGHNNRLAALTLGAIGVVYGDIGTSPLYAIRECFTGSHSVPPTPANILGVISLIFWSLILMISIKYVIFVMRADNRGEGGILALLALVRRQLPPGTKQRTIAIMIGVFGATLFYGDGMITPAISVLSAVEGLHMATPVLEAYVVPITVVILIGLFLVQVKGTAKVGAWFGPIMVLWFATLAVLGVVNAARAPQVLAAFSPWYAIEFFALNQWHGFLVLGAVFLVMTGGEALYADMGHFGKRPIRAAWFMLVLPAILLNYLGQGALLLSDPDAVQNPFYRLTPSWGLYPMVALATLATVIASQAVISGVFSLTRQAIQLGYCPRLNIVHTSEAEIGQIYIPAANWGLLVSVVGLVLAFHTSSNLAAAYGVAVVITMAVTTLLVLVVARTRWGWGWFRCALVFTVFLVVEMAFLSANVLKIFEGGWFPLLMGGLLYILMVTWRQGRKLLAARLREEAMPMDTFVERLANRSILRVPGTAVFLTSNPDGVPNTLLHNLRHNKVLHERVILLTLVTEEIPRVADRDRVEIHDLGHHFHRVIGHYGFAENPKVPHILELCSREDLEFNLMDTTFFLGRETLIPTPRPGMALWRETLFAAMSRNAARAMDFFRIPHNRVVELGTRVEL